jgi:hypothetical protein
MDRREFDMDGTPRQLGKILRKAADHVDPWGGILQAALWFCAGAVVVATMDFADVWICVGACGEGLQ